MAYSFWDAYARERLSRNFAQTDFVRQEPNV